MIKSYLAKIIAKDTKGLQTISACCSEGKVKISDIKYLKKNKIFLVSINRLSKESEKSTRKVNSIIRFEYIQSSRSKNIDQKIKNQELELISIEIYKKNNFFEITLLFLNNKIITLIAEIVEVILEDQKTLND